MSQYARRDDEWERMTHGLPGEPGELGVLRDAVGRQRESDDAYVRP
jgi:hypothetical protein